jgi:hypothetical protein
MSNATILKQLGIGVQDVSSSAIVDFASTTKGILAPRMTTTQRDAVGTPAVGLKIFNTTTGKENVYNGSSWEELASGDVSSWSGQTEDATVTELFLGGITNTRYTLQANSTTVFQLLCVARDGVSNKSKVWEIKAVAQRDGSNNSALVGTPSYTVIAQSDLSGGTDDWDIAVAVNDSTETFRVSATGATSTTIAWTIRG